MEEILRLQIPVFEENLPKEILLRSIVVVICVFVLGIFAQTSSTEYRNRMKEAEITGGCVQTKDSVRRRAEIPDRKFPCSINKVTPQIGMAGITEGEMPLISIGTLPDEAEDEYEGTEKITDFQAAPDSVIKEENNENLSTSTKSEPEAPIVLKVYVHGNGGEPELSEISVEADMFTIDILLCPQRMGKLFDGWYVDQECTVPFSKITTGTKVINLYAGWKEYPGFTANEYGYITGCTGNEDAIIEGLLRIPGFDGCIGIESGAFAGFEESITEIFIPANITYIAPDVFDGLSNLMYFEVEEGNPAYYSEYGILYHSDGTEAAYPPGRKKHI